MKAEVFLAVLFSAFFQAGWNFFAKRSKANKIALLAVGWFALGMSLVPFSLYYYRDASDYLRWLPFLLGTGIVHAFYLSLLGMAYNSGEISVVFPISRGMGIVGTAIASLQMGLNTLSRFGVLGIVSVSLGTLAIGLKEFPDRSARRGFLLALAVAFTVSTYSIVDSLGSKQVPTLVYLAAMNVLAPAFAFPILYAKIPGDLLSALKHHKTESYLVAIAGSVSYGIILWAYQRSPVAYVATLREISVAFAMLLGLLFLKERFYRRKLLGIALILLGVIFIKLA